MATQTGLLARCPLATTDRWPGLYTGESILIDCVIRPPEPLLLALTTRLTGRKRTAAAVKTCVAAAPLWLASERTNERLTNWLTSATLINYSTSFKSTLSDLFRLTFDKIRITPLCYVCNGRALFHGLDQLRKFEIPADVHREVEYLNSVSFHIE